MSVFQIVYASFIKPNEKEGPDEIIKQILKKAHVKNPNIGVTGILLYNGGVFIQLLEGEQAVVQKLYEVIATDPRHEKIKLLISQNSRERMFGKWSMAYKKLHSDDMEVFNSLLSFNRLGDLSKNDQLISNDAIMEEIKRFQGTL